MNNTLKITAASAVILAIGTAVFAQDRDDRRRGGDDRRGGIEQMLERFDTDGDGNVSKEEVEAAQTARFTEADTNGDGGLDADELAAMEEQRREEARQRRIERAHARLDANDDGAISADELNGDRMDRIFDRIDADEDGIVTGAELEEASEKMRRRDGHGKRKG